MQPQVTLGLELQYNPGGLPRHGWRNATPELAYGPQRLGDAVLVLLSLLVSPAFSGDDTGMPAYLEEIPDEDDAVPSGASAGGGGSGATGLGGFGGSLSTYRGPPPRQPKPAPLGERVDAQGVPLPELARTRLGSNAWQPGGEVEHVASFGDRAILGGRFGAVEVNSTGAILRTLSSEQVRSVAYSPLGVPAWIGGYSSSSLQRGDSTPSRGPCYNPATWSIAFLRDDQPLWACDKGLYLGPSEEDLLADTQGLDTYTVAPGGERVFGWNTLDPGTWDITLGRRKNTVTRSDRSIFDAAFSPSGALAIATEEGVTVDGVPLKGVGRSIEVAWHPTDERLAISTYATVLVHNGKKTVCEVELPVGGASELAWLGDTLLVGHHTSSGVVRIDSTTCALASRTVAEVPLALLHSTEGLWTAGERSATRWNPETGTSQIVVNTTTAADALMARAGAVWLITGGHGPHGALSERGYAKVEQPASNDLFALQPARFLSLDGPHWRIPSRAVSAGSLSGHAAWGHEQLFVGFPDGRVREYDLREQVDPGVKNPSQGLGMWGGMGMGSSSPPREVSPSWDPEAVRPRELTLVDLDWSDDGKRLAMLWTFLVTDAYGEDDQHSWIGILEPGRDGLAGSIVSGRPTQLDLSADGTTVAWLADYRVELRRIVPPKGWTPPEPEPELTVDDADLPQMLATRNDLEANELEGILGAMAALDGTYTSMFSDESSLGAWAADDPTLGGFGMEPGYSPVHRGDAQTLHWDTLAAPSDVRGSKKAIAVSADGGLLAVGSTLETALFRVDDAEPIWRYDLGQRGTEHLWITEDTLWVAGADSTVLGIPLP